MNAEPVEKAYSMFGEAHRNRHVREGVFEDQVPADDPRYQLTQRRVGIRVRRPRNGNHRGQLGVAEPGKRADDGYQHQRKRKSWTGAGAPRERRVMDQVIEDRSIQDRGGIELLPRDGCADDGKDARADDGSNAQRG